MAILAVQITVKDHDMAIKERRIWYFECQSCGKKQRKSHTRSKAKEAVCTVCLRSKDVPQQTSLFDSLGSEEALGLRSESESAVRREEEIKA